MSKKGKRVAVVPLQAEQILGLLTGALRVETPLPADTKLHVFMDGDSVCRQPERQADGAPLFQPPKYGKGIWLGIDSSVCGWVDEGGQMGIMELPLVPVLSNNER